MIFVRCEALQPFSPFLGEAAHYAGALILIGAVGAWRWSMWLAKSIAATFYRPIVNDYSCSATIVTTVYNEDPALFARAIESWRTNAPDRIIAAIDVTDVACIAVAHRYPDVLVVLNSVPGKRHGLAMGVDRACTDIVVLVDSDVLWAEDVLAKLKMPFADPAIGGVGTRASMIPTRGDAPTAWERLADLYLDLRFSTEVPATARFGRAVSCLSGRTSAYRTKLLQRLREPFLNETFLGRECISGDDKRYTTLVLEHGYQTWYQLDARVYSVFKPDFAGFVRQRLRWCRNSFRSDLRALGSHWLWRHPWLALTLFDKNLALFTQLNGPVVFVGAWAFGNWQFVLALLGWWHVSRAVKLWPHLRRCPRDWMLLPLYIAFTFLLSLIKFYALATMNRQGWLTRPVEMINGRVERTITATA